MDIIPESTYMSHLSPLETQREKADQSHDQDVTHIIAAEAEFAGLFNSNDTDTLIWLQVPQSSTASKMTCTGAVYPTNWLLRYSSAVLRCSGFEKFTQLLDDERYQKRKASDLMLSGLLGPTALEIMSKIRYVLDLGPSTDYDLRSEHLEALTLPKGIVQYSMMTRIEAARRVPVSTAGGHDDACHCFRMKIRGTRYDEPGYWINGQLKPLNLRSDSALNSTPVGPTSDIQAQTDEFNAAFSSGVEATLPSAEATGVTETVGAMDSIPESDSRSSGPDAPPSSPQGPAPQPQGEPTSPAARDDPFVGSIWDLAVEPEFLIDDYCEIRHVANVIRLLLAMAGRPLLLNSAARVYTIAGLAKLFGLKSSDAYHIGKAPSFSNSGAYGFANSLRSVFSDWFYTPNNTTIVDVLPEESFIIAWNIKLSDVARVTYRILVAERALQDAGATDSQPRKYQSRQKTVFGRELSGLLDEDMETMVDYASEAVVHRVLTARDTHAVETYSRNSAIELVAGLSAAGVGSGHEYDTLEFMFHSKSGVMDRLQAAARILEQFTSREQSLIRSSPGDTYLFLSDEDFPVLNALTVIRRLLDRLSYIARECFPTAMPNSDLLLTSYSNMVQRVLGLYVRRSTLHNNWFVNVYNGLPDDKKCMTAAFWRLLGRSADTKLANEFSRPGFSNLVEQVNEALFQAIVFAVPVGTEASRIQFQLDLIKNLKTAGLQVAYPAVLHLNRLELFSPLDIRLALHDDVAKLYNKSFDRSEFRPEFELSMLDPSPHLLLGLTTDEFRFLPLWAGGNNDGTGAVFEPALPTAQLGPISPGPAYHTGTTNTSESTASIDDAFSMAGPPSISDGGTERFTDAAMSDAGTEKGGEGSVSSSFVLVRNLNSLYLASERAASSVATTNTLASNVSREVNDGHSTIAGAHASIMTPSTSSSSSSSVAASSSFDDMVVVESAGSNRLTPSRGSPPLSFTTAGGGGAAAANATVDYEFEDDDNEDGIYNYEDDDDVEDQEYYDDDDADARSDDTVMPDREEVEQAMRQDVHLQQTQQTQQAQQK